MAEGMEHEVVQGHSTMHKEHLLLAVCKALGLEAHEHHAVEGIKKGAIKSQICNLKLERHAALQAHDPQQLKAIRRKIHRLKYKLRRATA